MECLLDKLSHGISRCVLGATRMFMQVALTGLMSVYMLGSNIASAQTLPFCPTGIPVVDGSNSFTASAAVERLEVRSGLSGTADWEWALGTNTQSVLTSVRGHTAWVSGRVYSYTLTYNSNGSGRMVVRNGATVVVDQTYNGILPLRSGNALRFYVTSAAGIGAGNRIRLTVDNINGNAVSAAVQTSANNSFSEQAVVLASTAMTSGFTASGTVTLTFTGSYPPTASRLNATINAGNIACQTVPEARITQLLPQLFSMQTGANVSLTANFASPLLQSTTIDFTSSNAAVARFGSAATVQLAVPSGATQSSVTLTGVGPGQAQLSAVLANGSRATSAVTVLDAPAQLWKIDPSSVTLANGAMSQARAVLDRTPNIDTSVSLATSPAAMAAVPATVTVPAGQTSTNFDVTAAQPGSGSVNANAGASPAQAGVAVTEALPTVANLDPALLLLGVGANAPLKIEISAVQATDTIVQLSTAQPTVLNVPTQVTVPAGQRSQTITIRGLANGIATLEAKLNGPKKTALVTVSPIAPALAYLTPLAFAMEQGASTLMEIGLSAVSTTDTTVTLSSSVAGRLSFPDKVVIAAGEKMARVLVTANTQGAATLTVTLGSISLPAVVNVMGVGPVLQSFLPTTLNLDKGKPAEQLIRLDRVIGTPRVVTLVSTAPGVLPVPAQVVVPAGESSVSVPLVSLTQGSSTLRATYGAVTRTMTINVGPPVTVGVSLSKTTLTLATGTQDTVSLRTHYSDGSAQDSTNTATWSTSAASVATVTTGNITGVAPGTATITAKLNDYEATAAVTVSNALIPLTLSAPASVFVGTVTDLTISRPTPVTSAVSISLTSSGGVFTVPTSAVIAAGASSVTVPLSATAIGNGTLVVSATGHVAATANIAVLPAPGPSITSITPSSGPVQTTVVTLTGVNFNANRLENTVTFAGANNTRLTAVVITASATELTARVPFGAVTGMVNVQTTLGTAVGPIFTVTSDQEVGFTASPVDVTVYQGSNAMVSLSLASLGSKDYQGLMELSVSGLPTGVTAEFSPTHLARGQSGTLVLTAASSAQIVAAQNLTVTATNLSGGFITTRNATVRLSVQAATGVTGVKGRFITPAGAGIAGFRVAVQDSEGNLLAQAMSDAAGNFLLTGLPTGRITLRMDGTPANPLYPIWPYSLDLPGNTIVTLADWTINPPPTDDKFTPINNATQDQLITDARFPGVEVTLPAGVDIFGYDGVRKTRVAVERITPDKLPTQAPPIRTESIYQLYFGTPMGGIPTAPIPVKVPNDMGLEPGETTELWYYDGMPIGGTGEWKTAGLGTVSADGKTISSNPGNGIPRFCGVCGLFCFADNGDRSENPPCDDCEPGAPPQGEGQPINLSTGQELDSAVDLVLEGDPSIVISRRFNPIDAFGFVANYIQSMGANWTFNYDVALMPFNDGAGDIRLVMPGNRRFNFTHTGNGEYKAATGPLMMQGKTFRRIGGASPTSSGAVPLSFSPAAGSATSGTSVVPLSNVDNCFFSTNATNYQLEHKDGEVWTFSPFPGATSVRIRGGCLYFLTEIKDARGRTLTIQRGSNGSISRITSSSGRYVQFFYNNNLVVDRITDSTGRSVNYTYESLVEKGGANGFGASGALRSGGGGGGGGGGGSSAGGLGSVIAFSTELRRSLVRMTAAQTPQGTYSYGYEDDAPEFRLGGPRYALSSSGGGGGTSSAGALATANVGTGTVDACPMMLGGAKISRIQLPGIPGQIDNVYGPSNRAHQQRWPDGTVRNFSYDIIGACVYNIATPTQKCTDATCPKTDNAQTAAAGWRFVGGRVLSTTVSDALGIKYTQRFNNNRIAQEYKDALGRTWQYERDSNNRITKTTDPLGRITRYFNDANGNPIRQIDAAGRITETDYTTIGIQKPTAMRRYRSDGSFISWQMSHDPNTGNLTSVRDPLGKVTQLSFDATSKLLSSIRTPGGRTTTIAHDNKGDPIRITDPLNNTSRMAYDNAGRLIQDINPLGQETRYAYNAQDQLTRVTDANGSITTLNYDANNRLASVIDPLTQTTDTFEYTPASQVSALRDAFNQGTQYRYDARNRLIERIDRRGQSIRFTYDAADQLTQVTRPDGSTHYKYDAVGRVIEIEESGSTTNRISFEYDVLDRPTKEIHQQGDLWIEITHQWDDLDRRIKRSVTAQSPTGSLPAQVTDYQYDNANRLTRITQGSQVTQYQWDDDNRLTQKTLPNGIAVNYAYDNADRLSTLSYRKSDGSLIEQLQYQYDAAGRRVQKDSLISPTQPETPFTAQYTNNRLTQITLNPTSATPKTYALTYDPQGNLISKTNTADATDQTQYTWDSRQRLTQLSAPGLTASFQYDSLNRRTERTLIRAGQPNDITQFIYDGMQVVGELKPQQGTAPAQSADLLTGLYVDELIAKTARTSTGTNTQTYLTDALGSAIALTRSDQSIASTEGYSPYGESDSPTQSDSGSYTGREQDGTGLMFYRARYYDPVLKRFISEDPIGLSAGTNRYSYVDGNPISFVDPLGLAACSVLFPDYPINTGFGFTSTSLGGHGGVVSWDEKGVTRYYEYGRYQSTDPNVIGDKRPADEGNVRRIPVPNLVMDPKTGQPTSASMERLRKFLSDRAGDKTRADMSCDKNADEKKVNDYAENFSRKRPPYSWKPWSSNQCRDFAENAYGAGR